MWVISLFILEDWTGIIAGIIALVLITIGVILAVRQLLVRR
ncbi:hypothetical protein [Bacillus sp. 2205SS5-2]